ncbi:uncharacterized protein LOC143474980 [Brachyhypopomus gauderio]|uniref:uncharacterized protein LOC143474980 n=1 Tax=Brachyhypopomus gauderio TaxID=698409 RepID=UPI004041EF6F
MVRSCCVSGCNNKSHDAKGRKLEHGARFFKFPTWKKSHGQQVAEMTRRRRMAWVEAVRRSDITFAKISPFMYVCSRHFHRGQPAYEMMHADPDWAPTLHLGHAHAMHAGPARSAGRSKLEHLGRSSLQPAETRPHGAGDSDQIQGYGVKDEPGLPVQTLLHLQRSHSSHSSVVQEMKTGERLWKEVFPEKGNTAAPLSFSEMEDQVWCTAGKSLESYHITGIFKSSEVLVSVQCLLELFKCCSVCLLECRFTVEGHERQFSVTQDCQSCGHHRVWRSHPTPDEETPHEDDVECVETSYSEVELQIALSDTEGTEQKYGQALSEKDWTHLSTSEEEMSEQDKEEKTTTLSPLLDCVGEQEAQLDQVDVDSDVSVYEEHSGTRLRDAEGTLSVWCRDCEADATLSCSAQRHSKVFGCARCGKGRDGDARGFHGLAVCFQDFASFRRHVEKEHGTKPLCILCQKCGEVVSADAESRGRKGHWCEHKSKHVICPECGKRFLTEVGLNRHLSKLHLDTEHLDAEQLYKYSDCPERFENVHKQNSHLESYRDPCF